MGGGICLKKRLGLKVAIMPGGEQRWKVSLKDTWPANKSSDIGWVRVLVSESVADEICHTTVKSHLSTKATNAHRYTTHTHTHTNT